MGRIGWRGPAQAPGVGWVAVLLAVTAFGVYALTMGQLVGYEPETAAASEGLVKTGQLRLLAGSPLAMGQGVSGRDGHRYSRTGFAQPVLEAPFYWVGEKLDSLSGRPGYRWRLTLLRLFSPVMAAVTVAAIFLLLVLRGISERRALVVAVLGAGASVIWPYSKIGMDTTLMALVAVAVLASAWAARAPSMCRYGIAGCAIGLAAAGKPYGALLMLGAVPLLIGPVREARGGARGRLLVSLGVPVGAFLVAIAWYNAYRTGSVTNFDDHPYLPTLLATPIHAIGLFASPGRGLLLYSPLALLGLIGLPTMWRRDRPLTLTVAITIVANTLVIASTAQWSDETWGPRYIVPSAWLLLLPIAYWAHGRPRKRAVKCVAVVAVCVQLVGIFSTFGFTILSDQVLSHQPFGASAYGMDASRWIPEASPLLLQSELALAWIKERVTGTGFVTTYHPIFGRSARLDLRHPARTFHIVLPDFWWYYPAITTGQQLLALALLLLTLPAAIMLARSGQPHVRWRRPALSL